MARNYTMPTWKILFAQASACAHPNCKTPLIFEERGLKTVVVQIAHIRSESDRGPRFDAEFRGDLNGAENLLLLCGLHHPPVDRHESAYTVAELLLWKTAQVAQAGGGTAVSDDELRPLLSIDAEQRQALLTVARLAQRVVTACRNAHQAIEGVRGEQEAARVNAARSFGPVVQIADDGTKTRMDLTNPETGLQLSGFETREWNKRATAARDEYEPRVAEALAALEEELAVFRMISPGLTGTTSQVYSAATTVVGSVGTQSELVAASGAVDERLADLWRAANGEVA